MRVITAIPRIIYCSLIFVILLYSCGDREAEQIKTLYVDSELIGNWIHIYDKSFGFSINEDGEIDYLRTNVTTGVLEKINENSDSISTSNGELSIYYSQICTEGLQLPYSFRQDTLTIFGFFEETGKYVRTSANPQFYLPSANTFTAELTLNEDVSTFSNNKYNFQSTYTLFDNDLWIVAEMNDINCIAGPKNYRDQIKYIYIHINPFLGTGQYELNSSLDSKIQFGDFVEGKEYATTSLEQGTLNITNYNEITSLLSGNFTARLKWSQGTDVLTIEEGSFSYKIYEEGPDY
jgi:hypothetical protein